MTVKSRTLAYGMLTSASSKLRPTLRDELERHIEEMRRIYEDRKKLPKHRNGRQIPRELQGH